MTSDEFNREGIDFTEKALKDLKEYCKGPDCNILKIILKIRNPHKYIKFLNLYPCLKKLLN
jgi:hypothetical protein